MCGECAEKHRCEVLDPLRYLVEELEELCLRVYQRRYEHALRVRLFGYGESVESVSNLRIEHNEAGLPLLMGAPAALLTGLNSRTRDIGPSILSEALRAVMQDRAKANEDPERDELALRIECDNLHAILRLCKHLLFATGPIPLTYQQLVGDFRTTRKKLFSLRA